MNYFDLHSDTPYEAYKCRLSFSKNELAVKQKSASLFKKWVQCFAFWVPEAQAKPFDEYKKMHRYFRNEMLRIPKNLKPIFAVEGGHILEGKIENLYKIHSDSIRILTLTWNGENAIAGGAKSDKRLTDFGKEVIRTMNDLKMACDISHLNEKSFFDALEYAKYPLASHSCCKRFCDSPRNLSDEQLKLLAQKGGVVGVCFYPEFLGDGNVFERIFLNIEHLLTLGLEENISIGSDFDGALMSGRLDSTEKIPRLFDYLTAKGMKKSVLDKFFYENAQKFFGFL